MRIPDTAVAAGRAEANIVPEADRLVEAAAVDQTAAGHAEKAEVYMGSALALAQECHLLREA